MQNINILSVVKDLHKTVMLLFALCILWLMCYQINFFNQPRCIFRLLFVLFYGHHYLRSDYKHNPDVLFSLSASTCICLGEI